MAASQSEARSRPARVLVVGAGASGLMAAGQAALCGAEAVLLEKTRRPGCKLSLTGKGRCNLTNRAPLADFLEAFGPSGKFLRQAFMQFFNSDLVAFLEILGVSVQLERGGRFFPSDDQAPDVVSALQEWAVASGVKVRTHSRVRELLVDGDEIAGVRIDPKKKLPADAVILATGGLAYPDTGSTGDGYALAEAVGHSIVPTRPALVPVETRGDLAARLQGLNLRNVTASLLVNGRKQAEMLGEVWFTSFGLSGPIILHLSKQIVDAKRAGKAVEISIDLKPALSERKLEARLLREFKAHGTHLLPDVLKELLPMSLVPVSSDLIGIPTDVTGNQITTAERRRLRRWLKDFRLEITGYRSFREAIITAGGINLGEINPRTMESRLVRGLYFAGEILDIDGPTGGYNLQAAFSTGWLAGRSAAGPVEAQGQTESALNS